MANVITGSRIILSIALMFCNAFSRTFYILYLLAGFTDMIDGTVARKLGTESDFGSRLDTVADMVFVAVCLIKLIPVIQLPKWIYVWVAIIAIVKISSMVQQKGMVAVHSVINKITGGLLFLLPLTVQSVDVMYSGAIVCIVATAAAIHERITVEKEKNKF